MIERDSAGLKVISRVARSEFILGGQKSGKSRRAELLARSWLQQSPTHRAMLLATAQPWDEEMRQRITRHQHDRAERVPGLQTIEEPLQLAQALSLHSQPHTLVVVDCLTLWLTNWLMPAEEFKPNTAPGHDGSAQAAGERQNGFAGQIRLDPHTPTFQSDVGLERGRRQSDL